MIPFKRILRVLSVNVLVFLREVMEQWNQPLIDKKVILLVQRIKLQPRRYNNRIQLYGIYKTLKKRLLLYEMVQIITNMPKGTFENLEDCI